MVSAISSTRLDLRALAALHATNVGTCRIVTHLMHYRSLWIREFPIRGLYHAHISSTMSKTNALR